MIKPTIGRVILFHPNKKSEMVFPALVCFVHNDALINVGGFDNNGNSFGATSVPLLQDGDEAPDFGAYATWMPYQLGQAKKTEELEKKWNAVEKPSLPELPDVPGVSGSAGMEELPKVLDAAVPRGENIERIVIGPSELDDLMPGSTVAPDAEEPTV